MRNPNNILLNDWPIVEHFGDVVTGGANQLHTALECLMVRPRAYKRRQKRVMNVDNPLRIPVDKVVRQNLHVACQHHEIRLLFANQTLNLCLGLVLVVFRDRNNRIRDLVEIGNRLIVRVIRNNQRDVAGQLSRLVAIQKIDQAMIVLRNQNDHAWAMRRLRQPPLHLKLFGDGRELPAEIREIFLRKIDVEILRIEFDPHQKQP